MCDTGIRNARNNIRLYIVSFRHFCAAVITHLFHTDPFIGACRISVVYPEERADLHIFSRLHERHTVFMRQDDNFPRSEFFIILIPQIFIGKAFKRSTECVFLFPDHNRRSAFLISGTINTVLIHQHKRQRTINCVQGIPDSFDQIILLIDQCCNELCRINISAAHFQKMGTAISKQIFYQFIRIIDLTHRCDRIRSMMRTHDQRLWFIIRDTADSIPALHLLHIFIKLCTERCVFYIVDRTVKAFFSPDCHATASCAQMRMIIHAKKQIKYTIFLCCYAKKATHFLSSMLFFLSYAFSASAFLVCVNLIPATIPIITTIAINSVSHLFPISGAAR